MVVSTEEEVCGGNDREVEVGHMLHGHQQVPRKGDMPEPTVREQQTKCKDLRRHLVAWVNARYFAAMEGGKVAFYREEDKGIIEAMQSSAVTGAPSCQRTSGLR